MSYAFTNNTTPATGAVAIWSLIALLKANSWTVLADSDGTTYNSSGGQVTGGASGAHGLGNASAWVRIRDPGGVREYTIQRGTADNTVWRIAYSPSAGFTTADVAPITHTPSATDMCAFGSVSSSTPTFSILFGKADGLYRYSCGVNTSAPYNFFSFAFLTGGTTTGGCHVFFGDSIQSSSGQTYSETDNWMVYCDGNATRAGDGGQLILTANWFGQENLTSYGIGNGFGAINWGFYAPRTGFTVQDTNSKDQLAPICITKSSGNNTGVKGTLSTYMWDLVGVAANPRDTPLALSITSGIDHIGIGCTVFPWDGSAITI